MVLSRSKARSRWGASYGIETRPMDVGVRCRRGLREVQAAWEEIGSFGATYSYRTLISVPAGVADISAGRDGFLRLYPGSRECHRRQCRGYSTCRRRTNHGVGFIGNGAILVSKLGTRGTAMAASIWATGAIGVAVGLGSYDTALVLSIATFATLRPMKPSSHQRTRCRRSRLTNPDRRDKTAPGGWHTHCGRSNQEAVGKEACFLACRRCKLRR